jgi:acetolactate synthase I/II/III large subunit
MNFYLPDSVMQWISVNGDGAFGINAMEIDTAVRHGAKAVFIVSNNAAWNIERYDQAENYAGRVVGTTLKHSDYAGMARALGAYGERVETPDALVDALRRALDNAPAVLDVVTSTLWRAYYCACASLANGPHDAPPFQTLRP